MRIVIRHLSINKLHNSIDKHNKENHLLIFIQLVWFIQKSFLCRASNRKGNFRQTETINGLK